MNVRRQGSDNRKFSINSMSEGQRIYDDPEWTVQRKKR